MSDRVSIKIPRPLYTRLQAVIEGSGFSSPTDFIVFVLRDLVGSIGLSAPTLGRLLRDGEPANRYLSPYVIVTPHGRTKALDLTPEGRMLASKIRAGVVPS